MSLPPLAIHDPARRRRAGIAAALGLALLVALAWRARSPARGGLAPDHELGGDGGMAEVLARGELLAERYPQDPRALYARSLQRSAIGDRAGAERDLREAVARLPRLQGRDPGRRYEVAVRATLAALWMEQRREDEARAVAAPACAAGVDGGVPATLALLGLCASRR